MTWRWRGQSTAWRARDLPMIADHYATLGVSPIANAAAIRAAYLALMREYHPDRNPDPEATLRAQAIIAAFKVLGDFDRRNHYDWDRRREREAAAAAAAKRPRKVGAGVVAGAIGLAAVGAWVFTPSPEAEPRRIDPPMAEARTVRQAKAKPRPEVKRVAVRDSKPGPVTVRVEKRDSVAKVELRIEPVRVAKVKPVRPKPKVILAAAVRPKPTVERAPVAKVAAIKAPGPRVTPVPNAPRQAKTAAKPAQQPSKPDTAASGDLASLDQFVMNFYGQSWRYGDAPKRAALVQSRNSFVVRRAECAAEACKRAAYLKLMRDVSEIVETGQPKTR